MGRTLGAVLVKGFGLLLAALLLLAAIAAIVGIVLAIVTTVVSAILSLIVLGLIVAAVYGLFQLFWARTDREEQPERVFATHTPGETSRTTRSGSSRTARSGYSRPTRSGSSRTTRSGPTHATWSESAQMRETSDESDDPLTRLRDRYVAGEIDETEFERRLVRLLDEPELDGWAGSSLETDRGAG